MHTLLIADDDTAFINLLAKELDIHPNYELISKVLDGSEAIEKIERYQPDIVLLDIVLPGIDGVSIVDHIRNHMPDYNPYIYILSNIGTGMIISLLNTLNIDFYSMKPVSPSVIIGNLNKIVYQEPHRRQADQPDSFDQIDILLMKLGLPRHHRYAKYIKAAINFCLENTDGTKLITKRLYPEIARQYQIAPAAVERSIRHGIHRIHDLNRYAYQRLFSDNIDHDRITNRVFLIVISEYIIRESLTED